MHTFYVSTGPDIVAMPVEAVTPYMAAMKAIEAHPKSKLGQITEMRKQYKRCDEDLYIATEELILRMGLEVKENK